LKELVKRKARNSDVIPVEVRSKEEAIELSLAENLQREDMHRQIASVRRPARHRHGRRGNRSPLRSGRQLRL
jgi:hypothetical protein